MVKQNSLSTADDDGRKGHGHPGSEHGHPWIETRGYLEYSKVPHKKNWIFDLSLVVS